MPNKNYINGRRFEYKVRDAYKALGYVALRSAGSHSPYDVIALEAHGEPEVITSTVRGVSYTYYRTPITGFAIQCKRRKLPARERPNHR
jgi:hypothetical protein